MMSSLLQRLSLFVILASGIGCGHAAATDAAPMDVAFRPTRAGARLWLATPFAVELQNEHDARVIEAMDPMYIGELGMGGGHVKRSRVAALAAEHGATHFRIVTGGDDLRVDVLLYRIEPERWTRLPSALQPAPPAKSGNTALSGT
jgi:hypothetical protein